MKIHIKKITTAMLLAGMTSFTACKKFVTVDPPVNQITAESTFTSDATASSAIAGIYSRLSSSSLVQAITPYSGMYSDELLNFSTGPQDEFSNSALTLTSSSFINFNFWTAAYQLIYPANLAIEKLENNPAISPTIAKRLTGEAKFIRAYLYLNLTTLFGEVPMVLTSDFEESSSLPRSTKADLYRQIVQDLKDASELLPETIEAERIRANKWAALSLLARAYLYDKQYDLAAQTASLVINSGKFSLLTDLSRVFLKNSTEAILQLYPTQGSQNTFDGLSFLPATTNETPKYYPTNNLISSISGGDNRKTMWMGSRVFNGVTYFYPAKYKVLNTAVLSEYLMLLRLSEQYLIRSEALIRSGNISQGIADLNIIRRRARISPTTSIPNPLPDLSQTLPLSDAILAVEQERRIELMFENGHRLADLLRTGRANAVLGTLKPNTWSAKSILWPIPEEQLRLNPNLSQNSGYFN